MYSWQISISLLISLSIIRITTTTTIIIWRLVFQTFITVA